MDTETKHMSYAEMYANNYEAFESFLWQPPDNGEWCIHYIQNRDSRLTDIDNAHAIKKILEHELAESDDIFIERHNHWAVGWVEGLVIRVYKDNTKELTEVFKKFCDILDRLNNYLFLDEDSYYQREYDATLENITFECSYAKGHEAEVFSWLSENNERAIENSDDNGGYPSSKEILEALCNLNLLSIEDRVELQMIDDPYDFVESLNDQECFQYIVDNQLEYDYTGIRRDLMNEVITNHMWDTGIWPGKPIE